MEEFIYTEFIDRDFRTMREWDRIKNENPAFLEVFKGMEIEAVKEIYETKDIVVVHDEKVSEFLEPGLDIDSEKIKYLIEKIGYMSIYNRRIENKEDGTIVKVMNVDNASCFRALLIINLLAIVGYAPKDAINFEIKVIFEKEEYEIMLGEMIKRLFPQVLRQITNITFEINEDINVESSEKIDETEEKESKDEDNENNDGEKTELTSYLKNHNSDNSIDIEKTNEEDENNKKENNNE